MHNFVSTSVRFILIMVMTIKMYVVTTKTTIYTTSMMPNTHFNNNNITANFTSICYWIRNYNVTVIVIPIGTYGQ